MMHSLGVIYVGLIFLATSAVKLYQYRLQIFQILELWISGIIALIVGAQTIYRYFGAADQKLGFAYPYYTSDPALISNWEKSNFVKSEAMLTFFEKIYLFNPPMISAIIFTVILLLLKMFYFRNCNILIFFQKRNNRNIFALYFILIFINISILKFPINLDGLALSSAFASNMRYSFGLKALSYIFIGILLANSIRSGISKNTFLKEKNEMKITIALVMMLIFIGGSGLFGHSIKRLDPKRDAVTRK